MTFLLNYPLKNQTTATNNNHALNKFKSRTFDKNSSTSWISYPKFLMESDERLLEDESVLLAELLEADVCDDEFLLEGLRRRLAAMCGVRGLCCEAATCSGRTGLRSGLMRVVEPSTSGAFLSSAQVSESLLLGGRAATATTGGRRSGSCSVEVEEARWPMLLLLAPPIES